MNAYFLEISQKTQNATIKPVIIRSQQDAVMVSGWAAEIGVSHINGVKISTVMDKTGLNGRMERISLYQWIWENRKTVNDFLRVFIK